MLLTIRQDLRLRINLLLKVVVVSPKQAKLKQPVTAAEVNQVLA
jgi:hypothetical protein